jgi:hypothetical protein
MSECSLITDLRAGKKPLLSTHYPSLHCNSLRYGALATALSTLLITCHSFVYMSSTDILNEV